ncbi:ATP-binding cassette domain-containing protein [Vibrio quintilis]|uniref:Putative ABC transporter ATP-binding protein YlmA n=1 Tax=Vibrio quintilis TaxID=1117707 RepID=A0A1M7YYP8_9VIBR|nr:ATP-binding cassette domain-containing protein [Vibrio quintilis]SHO57693.1 putative ABC transporter ATP-binding protein YlmA [Vibrio quintilis]
MQIKGLNYQRQNHQLLIENWQIHQGEHWGIFVAHVHSADILLRLFTSQSETEASQGVIELPDRIGVVSFASQQQLLSEEIARDETDFQDHIDYGTSVENLVLEAGCATDELDQLLDDVDLTGLRQRGFRQLSTGETRRLMLARALACHPELLVLHEPYSGLDVAHRSQLKKLFEQLSDQLQLLVITSRQEELPACTTHIALFDDTQLTQTMSFQQWCEHPVSEQLTALSTSRLDNWLALSRQFPDQSASGRPIPEQNSSEQNSFPPVRVRLNHATVEYTDGVIFRDLSWQIKEKQHWQIRGPNGCGKSSLLGLIIGDHPQCYANDIEVLGFQRGSGESIWDIKRHIGIVSSALHLQYRVSCSVLEVLLSGFFDSVGLYDSPSRQQLETALLWLSVLEMQDYEQRNFQQIDYGQQRLLLIVRALIKRPALLILDEPYQGLDYLNRQLVMKVLEMLAETEMTQLLYVSHYDEDSLDAIRNYVDFVPSPEGGYQTVITCADSLDKQV